MLESWYLLRSGSRSAAENMAVDEALLETVRELGRPVLRFYSWNELAATFGYAQRFEEAASLTRLRPLIRRPTGGGLVSHDGDWTYSLVFPPSHRWFEFRAVESYRAVHEWLRAAFARFGVNAELADSIPVERRGDCFARAERNDLLWGKSKLAGAAQRRNRFGLLIQGSIRPPTEPLGELTWVRREWEEALLRSGANSLRVEWLELCLSDEFARRANDLAAKKYLLEGYNRSR